MAKDNYQKKRDRIIPLAEQYANFLVPHRKTEADAQKWDRLFLTMMDEICKLRGIVRW